MGTLNENDKRYLAENLLAFFNRDYRRVAQLHVESGWVSRSTRVEEFESAIRTVCEPIFEKPLKDISFAQIVIRLFQVARQFNMEVQPQLILLQKTLIAIEGLGRQLYPDLDLWSTAKPFLEKWLREQNSPKALLTQLKQNLPFFVEQLPNLPKLIYEVMELKKEKLLSNRELTTLLSGLDNQSIQWKSLFLGIFVSFVAVDLMDYMHLFSYPYLTPIVLTGTVIAGICVLINLKIRN